MIDKEEIQNAKEYLANYKYQNEVSEALDIVLPYISELEKEVEELRLEKGYYLERYKEFNNAFIQGGKKLTEEKENE